MNVSLGCKNIAGKIVKKTLLCHGDICSQVEAVSLMCIIHIVLISEVVAVTIPLPEITVGVTSRKAHHKLVVNWTRRSDINAKYLNHIASW